MSAPPPGVQESLPPWQLTAECWLFPFWTSAEDRAANKARASLAAEASPEASTSSIKVAIRAALKLGLPGGAIHPLEPLDATVAGADDAFLGRLGAWVLYRYTDSPVGPYDELIYVAGFFTSPDGRSVTPRITNIFVSSLASVWNGRRNWNIPKHLAEFEWSSEAHSGSKAIQTVTISHLAGSPLAGSYANGRPFFSASLQPSRLPTLPVNTSFPLFPAVSLMQPPLHKCDAYTNGDLAAAQVGTERGLWRSTAPTFKGSSGLAYAKPLLPGLGDNMVAYGDGVSFPTADDTWSFGVRFRNVIVTFPRPQDVQV